MRIPSGRRRGGQPGNHNRLVHGLYARQRPVAETVTLERLGLNRGEMGLAIARARLKRLLDKQATASPADFLTYERAILRYLDLIHRLLWKNMQLSQDTGIPSEKIRRLLDLLDE